jgi:glycosyltransferase involved in cell wall biosynthesis
MVIDRFDDVKNGGVQSARRFVEYLRKEHEVTVIAAGEDEEGMVGLPFFFLPFIKQKMIKNGMYFAWPVEERIREVLEEVDVVHIQFPFLLGWKTAQWAREMNRPLVCGYHVQPENILYNLGIKSDFLVRQLHRLFISKCYDHARVVLSPSILGKNELYRHGLKSKCIVLSNGHLPEYKRNQERDRFDFQGRFVILSVGRISREKNHALLVEAVNRSAHRNEIQLILVGDGPEKPRMEEKMKRLPHAFCTGYVEPDDLLTYYSSADLYVHPSLVELESLTVLEAMAEGLPVMVSDSPASAATQFVRDERFVFQHDNPASLANKIDYLVENRDLVEQTGNYCYELAGNFTIEKSVERLVSVYEKCLEGFPATGGIPLREEVENPVS